MTERPLHPRQLHERRRAILEVVEAGKRVAAAVAARAPEGAARLAHSTGISPEMVQRALARNLERDVSEPELAKLLVWVGDEVDEVAVVLSAGVLTSPLRALALARAAGRRVTVHPSQRDPLFTELLVRELGADDVQLAGRFSAPAFRGQQLHLYGSDETVRTLRRAVASSASDSSPRVRVRSHGHGFGIVWVERSDAAVAARAIADDVIDFDQRGCLSPRVVFVRSTAGAASVAAALSAQLGEMSKIFPRAPLSDGERGVARPVRDTVAFAGTLYEGPDHFVGLLPEDAPMFLGPGGRSVIVFPVSSPEQVAAKLGALRAWVTSVGSDVSAPDATLMAALGVPHARLAVLGAMQTPPLDGPVDLRPDALADA